MIFRIALGVILGLIILFLVCLAVLLCVGILLAVLRKIHEKRREDYELIYSHMEEETYMVHEDRVEDLIIEGEK